MLPGYLRRTATHRPPSTPHVRRRKTTTSRRGSSSVTPPSPAARDHRESPPPLHLARVPVYHDLFILRPFRLAEEERDSRWTPDRRRPHVDRSSSTSTKVRSLIGKTLRPFHRQRQDVASRSSCCSSRSAPAAVPSQQLLRQVPCVSRPRPEAASRCRRWPQDRCHVLLAAAALEASSSKSRPGSSTRLTCTRRAELHPSDCSL